MEHSAREGSIAFRYEGWLSNPFKPTSKHARCASGRECIGRLISPFLAPWTLQTRWSATSGTDSRFPTLPRASWCKPANLWHDWATTGHDRPAIGFALRTRGRV